MSVEARTIDTLVSCLRDAVIRADSRDIVVDANAAATALIGAGRPVLGASLADLIPACAGLAPGRGAAERIAASLPDGRGGTTMLDVAALGIEEAGERFTILVLHPVQGEASAASELERALAEARVAQARLREIIEMLPQAVCVFDAQDRYVLWNERYAQTYPEIAPLLAPGVPFIDILRSSLDSGDMREMAQDPETWLAERMARHALPSSRQEQELRDGTWLRHDDRRLADGGAIGMRIDITEMKRKEASLRMLFEDNPVPMLIIEPGSLSIVAVNAAAIKLYGFRREDVLAMSAADLHLDSEAAAARDTFSDVTETYSARTIWRHRTACGKDLHVLIFMRALIHEQRPGLLTAVADVSDRVEAEAKVFHLANHDTLTGLANRFQFQKALESAIACRPPGGEVVIHCLDLDGFKPVNDTFGHGGGDEVLRLAAARLREVVRPGDLVARLGGDEFAILQTTPGAPREALAARLIAAFQAPFRLTTQTVSIGLSIGYAVAPRDGHDAEGLMTAADTALYAAKRAGKNTWRRHSRRRVGGG